MTGGSGFVGAHLLPRLARAGHSVRALARGEPPPVAIEGIEWIRGDLHHPASIREALTGVEGVYHLAGRDSFDPQDAPGLYALHVAATRELLEACRSSGVKRFILASTAGTTAVSPTSRVATEADHAPLELVGRWPYYLSKIYQERLTLELCRQWQLPAVVLNPGLILGPGDTRGSSTWTVQRFLDRDVPAMPNGGVAIADVRDVADAFVRALAEGEPYGKHLLGVNLPFESFFARLERLTGIAAPRLRLPRGVTIAGGRLLETWARMRGERPRLDSTSVEIAELFLYLDASKAERLLGFRARDLQETLLDTVRFLQRENRHAA